MRDLRNTQVIQGRSVVTKPKKLLSTGLKKLINMKIGLKVFEKNHRMEKETFIPSYL